MSSVSRFIRQVPLSTTYYNAGTVVTNTSTQVFELVPTSANYTGNYPPGNMQTASVALQTAIAQAVNAVGSSSLVLRDMGKTVYLPGPEIVDSNSSSAAGYISSVFRKVQYIPPDTTGTGSADGINYYTGYIRLGGVTYGGGTGVPTGVARLC